jgi:hypothetical protein
LKSSAITTDVFVLFLLLLYYNLFVTAGLELSAFAIPKASNVKNINQEFDFPIGLSGIYPTKLIVDSKKSYASQYGDIALVYPDNFENGSRTLHSVPNQFSGSNTLEYTSRFICGVITGENGPLRPGRYNTDINIFNRQNFPVSFLWKATVNGDNREHNYNIQNLGQGRSTSIDCTQILSSIPNVGNSTSEKYFEGALTINVNLDPSILSAISSSKSGVAGIISGSEATSVLSVDAIYTVNALKVSSREIVLQLVEYTINNRSNKIPSDMVSKILSLAVPIETNETIDPVKQIRSVLAREFSLTPTEAAGLDITVRGLSLGVGALDDNHALSLERINPYQPPA